MLLDMSLTIPSVDASAVDNGFVKPLYDISEISQPELLNKLRSSTLQSALEKDGIIKRIFPFTNGENTNASRADLLFVFNLLTIQSLCSNLLRPRHIKHTVNGSHAYNSFVERFEALKEDGQTFDDIRLSYTYYNLKTHKLTICMNLNGAVIWLCRLVSSKELEVVDSPFIKKIPYYHCVTCTEDYLSAYDVISDHEYLYNWFNQQLYGDN